MKRNSKKNYANEFIKYALATLPHRLLVQIPGSKFQTALKTVALGTSFEVKSFSDDDLRNYKKSFEKVRLWHGTGRYQYSEEGSAVDVLEQIIANEGLEPRRDVYSILLGMGAVKTTSTTKLRIIARCYADTHGRGQKESSRFGDSLWWAAYYYGLFYARVYARHSRMLQKNWKRWRQAATLDGKTIKWGRKVNRSAKTVWDTFGLGSDIENNYPIILGIASHPTPIEATSLANSIEVRFDKKLDFKNISHVEVPESKVDEVRTLIEKAGYRTSVFPIELGEYTASMHTFKELLSQ